MNVNPFVVVTSLVGKLVAYNVEYTITSGNLLGDLPKDGPTCVQLEVWKSKARVIIRVFSNCQVEVEHQDNADSRSLWSTMELYLKAIIGPASGGFLLNHY